MADIFSLKVSDSEVFAIDSSGNTDVAGTLAVTGAVTLSSTVSATSLLCDEVVTATVAATGGSGGATDGTLVVTLKQADESTALTTARQCVVRVGAAQYAPGQTPVSTVTFSTATSGTLVASGNGWALIETTAAGAFACTISDSADETVYVWCETASGVSDPTDGCVVIGSNSDDATWAA
jgi:hypothetical protein